MILQSGLTKNKRLCSYGKIDNYLPVVYVRRHRRGNTAYVTGVEMSNTRAVEEIEGMKRKTFAYHTAVLEAKEFHLKSMQNIAGFGQESRYYKEIYNISADIVMRCPRLNYIAIQFSLFRILSIL